MGEPPRHPGGGSGRDLQHRRQRAARRVDRLRQNRGGVLPHPHRVLGGSAPLGGGALHRAAQGAHQRPIRPPHRPVRRGGHPRVALARRRRRIAQGAPDEEPLGHPSDHARIPRGAASAQAFGDRAPVLRPALHRHRRGPFASARGPRRTDAVPDRAPGPPRQRQSPSHRAVRHHRRPAAHRRLPGGRNRPRHVHPADRGAGTALEAVDGALLRHGAASR